MNSYKVRAYFVLFLIVLILFGTMSCALAKKANAAEAEIVSLQEQRGRNPLFESAEDERLFYSQSTNKRKSTTTTAEFSDPLYYPLTDEERDIVERVVMAEAGGESYEGQMAVAQCILNASTLHDIRPDEAVEEFKYTGWRPDPTEEVKQAVAAVFDDGDTVFDRDVLYFYAPALCRSAWHESKNYVTTIGGHKFFKEARK